MLTGPHSASSSAPAWAWPGPGCDGVARAAITQDAPALRFSAIVVARTRPTPTRRSAESRRPPQPVDAVSSSPHACCCFVLCSSCQLPAANTPRLRIHDVSDKLLIDCGHSSFRRVPARLNLKSSLARCDQSWSIIVINHLKSPSYFVFRNAALEQTFGLSAGLIALHFFVIFTILRSFLFSSRQRLIFCNLM